MDRRVKIIRVTPFAFLFFSRFVDAAFGSWMLRGGMVKWMEKKTEEKCVRRPPSKSLAII